MTEAVDYIVAAADEMLCMWSPLIFNIFWNKTSLFVAVLLALVKFVLCDNTIII